MAVMQNSIIFGGVDSADFGIYIGGEGTFDAPKRDVEMISIPGRNGAFALDKGRFQNIEVTYSAFNHEPDLATFSAQLEGFRNAICSQKGYQRLTDTFHPDEYRMAAYIDGLEIKPIEYNTAATFDITFDCKPQRWLTSGETEVTIANSGDTITNPTLFEAAPMLEVEGYGDININDEVVSIAVAMLGEVPLNGGVTTTSFSNTDGPSATGSLVVNLDTSNLNNGDAIFKRSSTMPYAVLRGTSAGSYGVTGHIESVTNGSATVKQVSARVIDITLTPNIGNFTKGTSASVTTSVHFSRQASGGLNSYGTWTIQTSYDADNETITLSSLGVVPDAGYLSNFGNHEITLYQPIYYGDSTKVVLPHPMYIDLDIGEAYGVSGDTPLSFDNVVTLPAELPKLKSGANTITFDNTVTDLKVVPRWWKI